MRPHTASGHHHGHGDRGIEGVNLELILHPNPNPNPNPNHNPTIEGAANPLGVPPIMRPCRSGLMIRLVTEVKEDRYVLGRTLTLTLIRGERGPLRTGWSPE